MFLYPEARSWYLLARATLYPKLEYTYRPLNLPVFVTEQSLRDFALERTKRRGPNQAVLPAFGIHVGMRHDVAKDSSQVEEFVFNGVYPTNVANNLRCPFIFFTKLGINDAEHDTDCSRNMRKRTL